MTPTSTKPPLIADLSWEDGLRFIIRSNGQELRLDGDTKAAASPVQALAAALAGCMATDIVHILTKGRLPLAGFEARFEGARADDNPRRFTAIRLHIVVKGDVPADKVERAIALSRETYCSVWHSLRQDLDFTTSFEVQPAPSA